MGTKLATAVPVADITAVAAEVTDFFAEAYANEYALQLTEQLRRGNADVIT